MNNEIKNSYLGIYAFNDKEYEILNSNENITQNKIKLSSKDIKIYFWLKDIKKEISLTDFVKDCLIKKGYDINSKEMFKPRKNPNTNKYYKSNSFWGNNEYRVDTFSRSLSKLIKVGLVKKKKCNSCNVFETIIKN